MKTDTQIIRRFLTETHACAIQMMQNAAYIQKEIPSLEMPDALRVTIGELCDELIGTKHDLIHEIHEIEPLITSDPDSAQVQHGIASIRQWTAETVGSINHGIAEIQEAVAKGSATPMLGMLVMESAVNILNAIPGFPETEEEPSENDCEDDDDKNEYEDAEVSDPNCYAFYTEDSYPVSLLIAAIRRLMARPELTAEITGDLKVFLFAMERLPLVTPGVRMSLGLRLDQGGESDWIEIRMEDGEFTLSRGTWIDGDADTEAVFEVTSDYRDGDAFMAAQFAESFSECARDVCREVVIEDTSDEPFTGWDLESDKKRWASLPCSFY